MKKTSLWALCLILAACSKNISTETNNEPELMAKSGKQSLILSSENDRFIIDLSGEGRDLAAVRNVLASTGAEETGYLPELQMMFVRSSEVAKLTAAGLNVGVDLEVYNNPNAYPDNPPVSAGTNDSWFRYLWALDAIDAPQAWNAGYRGAGVTVAVLDCGFYTTHTDLAANLLVSSGRNFVNWGAAGCAVYNECDPADVTFKIPGAFSHATHVAGTIAAVDNNSGIIGVAPDAKILPVKVLSDFTGTGALSWVVQGIFYAVNNGAQVINLSLGGLRLKGSGKGSNLVQQGLRLYDKAIQYAKENGVVVVAAAGNDGLDLGHPVKFADGSSSGSIVNYPSSSPHAISVSATTTNMFFPGDPTIELDYGLASYSNYGISAIDLSAPGGDFVSGNPYDYIISLGPPGFVTLSVGTSMAAPHVAGVAALVIGKHEGNISASQVKTVLTNTADDLGKPGRDPYFGRGRVNAFKALQ